MHINVFIYIHIHIYIYRVNPGVNPIAAITAVSTLAVRVIIV